MIELMVIEGETPPIRYEFPLDEISIGRRSVNDLVLPEASVSSRHARIYLDFDQVKLEDLKSTNGTLVNGQEIQVATAISRTDVVTIGAFTLRLVQAMDQAGYEQLAQAGPAQRPPAHVSSENDPRATEYLRRDASVPPGALAGPGGNEIPAVAAPLAGKGISSGQAPGSGKAAQPPASPPQPASPSQKSSPLPIPSPAARDESTRHVASSPNAPITPSVPKGIEETGLQRGSIVDLMLKTTYFAGEISGYNLADSLKLPFKTILEPLIADLRRDKLLEVKGGGSSFGAVSMIYSVTTRADELIRQILDRNRYVGPAPVSIEEYLKMVSAQSVRRRKIPKRRLIREFDHLVLEDDVFDGIGPAMNSGSAMLFFGPPGNGKSAICQAMINCYDDAIFVPYAVEVDGNIIKIYDEHNHCPLKDATVKEGELEHDPRWLLCHRPLIMVGGELSLEMLDMSYSPEARFYEAPIQMKANGGVLLVDDFGRQKASPRDLLNRWIVPLESQFDFISLVTGKKLKVPFDVFVVFATNLEPESLVDDAFLRRVRYKLEVKRPTLAQFRRIMEMACAAEKIPFLEEGYKHLLSRYEEDNRPFNACEPRNLLDGISSLAEYLERPPALLPELLDKVYRSYFTRTRRSLASQVSVKVGLEGGKG